MSLSERKNFSEDSDGSLENSLLNLVRVSKRYKQFLQEEREREKLKQIKKNSENINNGKRNEHSNFSNHLMEIEPIIPEEEENNNLVPKKFENEIYPISSEEVLPKYRR